MAALPGIPCKSTHLRLVGGRRHWVMTGISMRMIADSECARESRARRTHFPPRGWEKWYNTNVVRATERPYRSGTGFTAHPAIALTALHHCKHDVLRKYWTYFKSERHVCELCVLRGAFSYPCIRFRPVQGFLRVHGEGNVRPLFHVRKTWEHT